jgi:type I restriction enzyme M protein
MKRSLGDKRRYLDQAALDAVTREHGALENSQTSRVFDNSDFGYRRITVLRPLRLRFQITEEARERFLNTCPELYDALQAVQDALGSEPLLDWNQTWDAVQQVFKTLPDDVEGWAKGAKGTAQKKIFRDCFTVVDPEAAPVIAKRHKKGDAGPRRPCSRSRPCPPTWTLASSMPCSACTPTARASTSSTNPTRR